MPRELRLIGRASSHFTRVAALYADELGLEVTRVVVADLTSIDSTSYGGHPGLKIPTLVVDGAPVFGAEHICRRLAGLAGRADDPTLVWPEDVAIDVVGNAQELTWHAMAAQVQIVAGTVLGDLPREHRFFAKAAVGLVGSLGWLDAHLPTALAHLPTPRALSLLEVTAFCLIEHLAFRPSVPLAPYAQLIAFAADFARRPSARRTAYRLERQPAPS